MLAHGDGDGLRAICRAYLRENGGHMFVHAILTDAQLLGDVVGSAERREDDDLCGRQFFVKLRRRLCAVFLRHHQIHDFHVGCEAKRLLYGHAAGDDLGNGPGAVRSALVAELKRTGISKRIIGFHICGFRDSQFGTPSDIDYSPLH